MNIVDETIGRQHVAQKKGFRPIWTGCSSYQNVFSAPRILTVNVQSAGPSSDCCLHAFKLFMFVPSSDCFGVAVCLDIFVFSKLERSFLLRRTYWSWLSIGTILIERTRVLDTSQLRLLLQHWEKKNNSDLCLCDAILCLCKAIVGLCDAVLFVWYQALEGSSLMCEVALSSLALALLLDDNLADDQTVEVLALIIMYFSIMIQVAGQVSF